jgi:hypothetical protein
MSNQELDKLLGALREESRSVEAPRHVEAALLGAFRAQAPVVARRGGWMHWAMAAAAMVAVVIGAGVWKIEQPVAKLDPVRLAVAPPPVIATAPTIALPVVARRVNRPVRRHVEPVKMEIPPVQEVATDFMPLEDSLSLPPIESGHVMRVQMPRSSMMRFGFPVNPDRMMEPVKADVVFGQEGIARAVRFVR